MKQKILLLLCIVTTLGLASCKKETIVQDTPNRTFNYTIQPNQWKLSTDGYNYTVEIGVKEIDQITLDDEGVLVYLSHPIIQSSYIQLPYTYDVNAYSYELYNGGIAIDIQSSDAQATRPTPPTKAVTVKIVILPSKYTP